MSRDENIVDANNSKFAIGLFFVLKNDLSLAVGTEPWDSTGVSLVSEFFAQLVSEPMRIGVQALFIPLVGGVAEHKALIAGSRVFFGVTFATLLRNNR